MPTRLHIAIFCIAISAAAAAPVPLVNPSAEINDGADGTAVSDPSVLGWDGDGQVKMGSTDYGNGGWRLSLEDGESVRQMTGHTIAAGEAFSLRFDAAIFGGPVLVGPGVNNGDFNEDASTEDSRPFTDTPAWFNLAGNQGTQATRITGATPSFDGTRNAVVSQNDTRVFAVDTGHLLSTGEVFEVSYQWRDASNWDDANDRIGVTLFTTDDDTTGGVVTEIETQLSDLSTTNSTYENQLGTFAPIPASADGKRLFVSFTGVDGNGNTGGFARVDNFSLGLGASGVPDPRELIADLYVDDGGTPLAVATRSFDFKSGTIGSWHHYHLAIYAGMLDAHVGKTLGLRFRSNDTAAERFQSVDNIRLESWPTDAPDGSFADDWNSTPDQVWAGPGYWANRLHDWEVRGGRVNCILGGRDRRTLHRVGTSIRGNGGDFALSVRTGLHAGTDGGSARSGFLIGAGPNLDWRGALLVHDGLGRDFGLFAGMRSDGTAVIEDYSTNAVTQIAGGATPAGGYPADVRLALDAEYNNGSGEVSLTIEVRDAGDDSLLSSATVDVPSDRVLGSFGLLSHKGNNSAQFWFDDFSGSGAALNPEPERHLAILGSMYTLSRGTLKLTAQLSPLDRAASAPLTLETWDGATWSQIAAAAIDNTDGLSSYTATFSVPGWDDSKDTPVRIGVSVGAETFHWTGTVRRDPVDETELVVAATTCQRISDGTVQNNGYDWSPVRLWQPHTLAFEHIAKQNPDLLLALGDQIYEGQPTPEDSGNDFNRQHDYLYKWYLWVLQARELTREMPTIAIPDDHDVFQGNLWGEGGIATASQNTGGYEEPASWVRLVERTQTSHLPDPDPYNSTQPAPPVAQGIGVYFTGMVYGEVGFAILEDRKFKTGRDNPPADLGQQFLLGDRQKEFLADWTGDWDGQCVKAVISQSPFGNLHTHAASGYNFGLNDRDSHGWPVHRRNEIWTLLRKARMFQIAGDQHLATVVHHGSAGPRDAGYSFTAPAIANFFPRCWDPVHNSGGRINTVSPYKGEFFFDGNGTLPTGEPNLTSSFPHHIHLLAAANPLQYHNQTTGIDPANLHDRGAGYGIVRIDKATRQITFECWPIHADPEFPQTGSQFPDWPLAIRQTDNDGRNPTGFLPVIDAGWRKDFVVRVSNEESGELLYAMRVLGNRFRPPVYDNNETYRVEIAYGDAPVLETLGNQSASTPGAAAIRSFLAQQPAIVSGGTATLQWDVEAPATLSIDNGVGDVSPVTVDGIGQIGVSPIADATYTLTLNGGITAQASVRVFPDQATWLADHFSAAELLDPLVSGDDADPDLDGLTNWQEFLFQTDPRVLTSPISSAEVVEDGGQHFVEFELPTPVIQTECSARIATSDDLETWTLVPANGFVETGRDTNPAGGTPRVRLRLNTPIPGAVPRKFYQAYWGL